MFSSVYLHGLCLDKADVLQVSFTNIALTLLVCIFFEFPYEVFQRRYILNIIRALPLTTGAFLKGVLKKI